MGVLLTQIPTPVLPLNSNVQVLGANPNRKSLVVQLPNGTLAATFINFGSPATSNTLQLIPGQVHTFSGDTLSHAPVHVFCPVGLPVGILVMYEGT